LDREKEIGLIDELLGLRQAKSAFLDEDVTFSDVRRYTDPNRFQDEITLLFRTSPIVAAHASELTDDGDFLVREVAGQEILLTRDRDGGLNAFQNVCRHRGMQLVPTESGCRHRFTCPYHAWTWDNTGRLIGIPHREQGFPDIAMEKYGLKRLAAAEHAGMIWVQAAGEIDAEAHLGKMADDFAWIGMPDLVVHTASEREWATNWKIAVEGGLEAYHFRVAHAKTIAGLFHDNLSTYEMMGPHIRSVLARNTVDSLAERPRDEWFIREHSNLLYTLVPGSVFLVQSDHVVWLSMIPRAVDRCLIRMVTLKPTDGDGKPDSYWDKNHALTEETLNEDFAIGEKIQAGFGSGTNQKLTFGRFEGALDAFSRQIDVALRTAPEPHRLHA